MKLSEELQWRGFINQMTFKDITDLDNDSISFYWGVDPSADSMQIGNLAAAMMVRTFIAHGHKPYLLVGGATGMIGDPDGKAQERTLQTLDTIKHNKEALGKQYSQVFAGLDFTLVDNYDWFKDMGYLDFLREVGKYVPMSQMLGREFVQSRLGNDGAGISYAEFSYSLIQGYDFLHLFREFGVTLQVCGADQWGNSIAGVDLIRRLESTEAHVYSTPLIVNKTTGVKFGKSEGGAIWLDAKKTSVYKFYQFWLNIDDEGVIDYLKVFTTLDKEKIDAIEIEQRANPSLRVGQKRLAHEVTLLVHGEERTKSVERVTAVLFGTATFASLNNKDIEALAGEIPTVEKGNTIIDTLVRSGIASSNGDARRLLEAKAVSVNGEKVFDDDVLAEVSLVKKGKNSFVLVR